MDREQIIKALEWCIQSEDCEYCEYNKGNIDVCSIRSDALALIKEQDEQIFKLQNLLKENENGYAQTLFLEKCKNKDLTEKNKELQEKNESLAKTEVAREIFEGIEEIIKQPHTVGFSLLAPLKQALSEYDNNREKELLYYVAKLKKKYIGE